jgi:predicted nucleic acid-binding protein
MIVVDSSVAFALVVPRDAYHLLALAVIQESPLSAYDAEYVALAKRLGCSLVTTDKQVLDHYPNLAIRLQDFAGTAPE